jgi:hypothetical protein
MFGLRRNNVYYGGDATEERMMQLELTEQEKEQLVALVKTAIEEISPEIHHAMDHDYREQLRQRRAVLEGLLKRLTSLSQPVK